MRRSADGDILIQDLNVSNLPPVKRGTAMMFQSYALFPHFSCLDNVAFSLKMRGVAKKERYAKARNISKRCTWRISPSGCRRNCRAASSSASRWRGR
jgi:ABC-type sugar transport system ATPase subunit